MPELSAALPASRDVVATTNATLAPRSVIRNVSRDIVWQVFGAVGTSMIALGMHLAVVRLLGREGYGGFGLVQTAANWCALTFSFGAGANLLIQAGQCRKKGKSRLVGSGLIYLILTVSVTWMLVRVDPPGPGSLVMPQLSPDVGLLVVLLTGTAAFFALARRVLEGADRFRLVNFVSVAWRASLAGGAILGAYLTGNCVAALWGGALGTLLSALTIAFIGIKSWGIALPSWQSFWRMGGTVGLRAYVAKIAEAGAETFGIFYLSFHHDLAGVAAVVACQRISMVVSKPASITQSLLKGKVAGQKCSEADAKKALQLARFTLVTATLLILPLIVLVRPFIRLALGEAFDDTATVMALFLLSETFRAHGNTTAGIFLGQGCRPFYVAVKVAVCVGTVVGVLLTGPTMGATGVALVQCTMSAVMAALFAIGLSIQAGSAKAVFVANDRLVLSRVVPLKRIFRRSE